VQKYTRIQQWGGTQKAVASFNNLPHDMTTSPVYSITEQ